ncbi:hypothetical protein BD410DRAFT_834933 [Rickenella mellea]|uniref:Autophagy-related protein 14 n=1 Tax=Rickenella mellea TaxID=50990 RepID=A0A4Y7QNU0_9AGAM|nr:hypothetical protein BD410DRAFT_834933 [Rickenella mellea]
MSSELDGAEYEPPVQSRLRHVTSIQVRNLTPFPTRDSFASALTQRAGPSQFASPGYLTDDTDIALARHRSRKISTTSATTMRSRRSEGGNDDIQVVGPSESPQTPIAKGRRRTNSRASAHSGPPPTTSSPPARRQPNTISFASTPSVRLSRPRAGSRVPVTDTQNIFGPSSSASSSQAVASASVLSSASSDHSSQADLEKIIWSRLVESFITINHVTDEGVGSPSRSPPLTPMTPPEKTIGKLSRSNTGSLSHGLRSGQSTASHQASVTAGMSGNPSTMNRDRSQRPQSSPRPGRSSLPKQPTSPPSRRTQSPRTRLNASPSSPGQRKADFPRSPPATPPPTKSPIQPHTPIYISPFHRPSTNPAFKFDATEREFAEWADLSASNFSLTIWGRAVSGTWKSDEKGKGKEVFSAEEGEWKVLQTWNVDLSELVPLNEELELHPSLLPSNSLLVTLNPPGRTYYLPSNFSTSETPSRSQTPEYNSDPEVLPSSTKLNDTSQNDRSKVDSMERGRVRGSRMKQATSAGWQDLVRIVTLQACIIETQDSLREIISKCDTALEADVTGKLRREASEREHRIRKIQESHNKVWDESDTLQQLLRDRRTELQRRREILTEAKAIHEDDILSEFENGTILAEEKRRHSELVSRLPRVRTSLLTTLASTFPIELLSPPDLLFTILSVPLPIPLNGSDPAPPLTLVSHSEVTEDSVATALGYAAQVVQLMAAYLCHGLVYPVTYIGSRSLIKDPISTMIGPRMFPLYSKGVDTYRFEYAVFLLNKNIEMIMSDRNLRALDIRHTLPNLKNLLLTLTDGDTEQLHPSRNFNASTSTVRALDQDSVGSRTPTSTRPSASELMPSTSGDSESSSTLTISSMTSFARRPKSYLGLSPLTSMFRVRYPSSTGKPSVKPVEETPEDGTTGESASTPTPDVPVPADGDSDDDEDRMTIRGLSVPEESADKVANGRGPVSGNGEPEKLLNGEARPVTVASTVS